MDHEYLWKVVAPTRLAWCTQFLLHMPHDSQSDLWLGAPAASKVQGQHQKALAACRLAGIMLQARGGFLC